MKKNVLALSITAALFGLTGGAQAMTGALGGAGAGSNLALNGDGVGHILLVPYFSAQSGNNTLINLVNTDQTRGKAVKVRFRGAANSDDIFDFQVFLSPGDVWTANISQDATGPAKLTTADNTCTKPAKADLNRAFVTARLDSTMTDAQKANGTREGYIEIFNMGDIPPLVAGAANVVDAVAATTAGVDATAGATANPLYTAIKHNGSGVAPCTGSAWTALDTNDLTWDTAVAAANTPRSRGLLPPTTGLMANWTIINTVGAAAWSGEAFAIEARDGANAATTGHVVYWPQTSEAPAGDINHWTADPLIRTANVYSYDATVGNATPYNRDTTAAFVAGKYDLPDVSTPYTTTATAGTANDAPLVQARTVTAAIAASAATNEFLTTTSIGAATDWVFSQPTRRYSVALDYSVTASTTDGGRRFSSLDGSATAAAVANLGAWRYFDHSNTTVATDVGGDGRQVCVTGITTKRFDREEVTPGATTPQVVVSPQTISAPAAVSFCGEATVLGFNIGTVGATTATGALKASVAIQSVEVTYSEGWARLGTPAVAVAAGTNGLPVLGSAFVRAVGASGGQTFGAAYKHRFAR